MICKPTFEELADASLKTPVLAQPPPNWVPYNDSDIAINQLRGLSDGLKRTQRGSQTTRARADAIVPVCVGIGIVFGVLAIGAHGESLTPTFADIAAAANAAQGRADLLDQYTLMGQLQLHVRNNNARIRHVVARAARSLPTAHAVVARRAQQNVDQQIAAQTEAEQVPIS